MLYEVITNIARCHENLGDRAGAMDFYRQALDLASDPRTLELVPSRTP